MGNCIIVGDRVRQSRNCIQDNDDFFVMLLNSLNNNIVTRQKEEKLITFIYEALCKKESNLFIDNIDLYRIDLVLWLSKFHKQVARIYNMRLVNNKIEIIENNLFTSFNNVKNLYISNPIKEIKQNAFHNLINLEHLTLNQLNFDKLNSIETEYSILEPLINLKTLIIIINTKVEYEYSLINFLNLDKLSLKRVLKITIKCEASINKYYEESIITMLNLNWLNYKIIKNSNNISIDIIPFKHPVKVIQQLKDNNFTDINLITYI